MEAKLKKWLIVAALLLVALVSFLPVADKMSAPATHARTIASIDDKISTVLALTASSTLASAGISAVPDDTATPIAEKLADFSEYFLVILCVLYAEKYLLTILGAGVFKILIPCACVLFGISLFWNPKVCRHIAAKLVFVGLALAIVIPLSVRTSDMIYDVYKSSIDGTIQSAQELSDETLSLTEAKSDAGLIERILDGLSETVNSLLNKAAKIVNRFIESIAVMVVTSCLIPLLVLLFFLWLIKAVTGIDANEVVRRRRAQLRGGAAEDTKAHDAAP